MALLLKLTKVPMGGATPRTPVGKPLRPLPFRNVQPVTTRSLQLRLGQYVTPTPVTLPEGDPYPVLF